MILGHAHPEIVEAIITQAKKASSFGAPTELELRMANKVCEFVPSIEMLRMVNSGTEATLSAIRLARGYTEKDKIIKFAGCYHGHHDALLVEAGSGALTMGVPSSPGVPASVTKHTLIAQFNDLESVSKHFAEHSDDIAAIILEPVTGNMGCILPEPGFLEGLRKLCDQYQSLLIFDEVMTGFRIAKGGAQEYYNVLPDITTLGKIIGAGLPAGAFGGKKEIMEKIAPTGPIYHAGTLSGNPLAMAAGLKNLELIEAAGDKLYEHLDNITNQLAEGLTEIAKKHQIPVCINHQRSMFTIFFTDLPKVNTYKDVLHLNRDRFNQ